MFKSYAKWFVIFVVLQCVVFSNSKAIAYQQEKSVAGQWTGELNTGNGVLHIVFNISKKDDGDYSATLDSPDQGAKGIPVGKVVYEENKITLTVPAIAGSYEGSLSEDESTLVGIWNQGNAHLKLVLKKGTMNKDTELQNTSVSEVMNEIDVQRLAGKWLGTLNIKSVNLSLRIIFNIKGTEENRLQASLDSPDQNARGIPVSHIEYVNNHIKIEVRNIGGVFEGDISTDNAAIKGTWQQGGNTLPLQLKKVAEDFKIQGLNRPQEPKRPYPYIEEEVTYPNSAAGIMLAGTLTIPKGQGPFPAVVLISGSGAQDRNETFMGHKPFLVWADYLTRHGIAVLRFDDRGFGKSSGDFASATSLDFETDVEAGVRYLQSRPEIKTDAIGLIGHSEGGLIAPIAAVKLNDIAFIVLMAGPGLTGAEINRMQQASILRSSGLDEKTIGILQELNKKLLNIVQQEKDDTKASADLRDCIEKTWATLDDNAKEILRNMGQNSATEAMIKQLTSPWFRYFISHDPQKWLKQVKCPVLALNGEKDVQVSAKENLKAIRTALKKGGNKHYTVKELPGLNHLFQKAETGTISEYNQIEQTTSPRVLQFITDWILEVTK